MPALRQRGLSDTHAGWSNITHIAARESTQILRCPKTQNLANKSKNTLVACPTTTFRSLSTKTSRGFSSRTSRFANPRAEACQHTANRDLSKTNAACHTNANRGLTNRHRGLSNNTLAACRTQPKIAACHAKHRGVPRDNRRLIQQTHSLPEHKITACQQNRGVSI